MKQTTAQAKAVHMGDTLLDIERKATAQATKAQTATATADGYTTMLRSFERAYTTGDYTAELLNLATAVARSVTKKLSDPQRKTAVNRETVSTTGCSPVMLQLRREITADVNAISNLRELSNNSERITFNADGDLVVEILDTGAKHGADVLVHERIGDGMDLVQTAVATILEQAQEHATAGAGWMEMEYTARRLSRKVAIKATESAEWVDETTAPIQEVYRAVRRAVDNSRAVSADPRNGYLYIDEIVTDPESDTTDTLYRRLGKWVDLGGYEHSGHIDASRDYDRGGQYTADAQTAYDYNNVLETLNLTDRQLQIIRLRGMGYGYKAIGTYLGVSFQAVQNTMKKVQAKCEKIGFTPSMWAEMTTK